MNDVKKDLEKAFESYYDLTFGSYNLLDVPQEKKIRNLGKLVMTSIFDVTRNQN